jgi:hypothetical protein
MGDIAGREEFGDKGDKSEWREEKKERWRFHMSIKLENTEVSRALSRSGCGVSNEAINGVRKCCAR